MSFQSRCILLGFENSIEVVKFDITSVYNSPRFFHDFGHKANDNKIDKLFSH